MYVHFHLGFMGVFGAAFLLGLRTEATIYVLPDLVDIELKKAPLFCGIST